MLSSVMQWQCSTLMHAEEKSNKMADHSRNLVSFFRKAAHVCQNHHVIFELLRMGCHDGRCAWFGATTATDRLPGLALVAVRQPVRHIGRIFRFSMSK